MADRMLELRIELAEPGEVSLAIYDLGGNLVETLVDGPMSAGSHDVRWTPADGLPDGIYYCRLRSSAGIRTRPLTLLRR